MDINFGPLADKEAAFILSALAEFPIKACGNLHRRLTEQYETQIAARALKTETPAPDAAKPE